MLSVSHSWTFPATFLYDVGMELYLTDVPCGFVSLSVHGDGNCFYCSARVMATDDEENHSHIRTFVMKELQDNPEHYADLFIARAKTQLLTNKSLCLNSLLSDTLQRCFQHLFRRHSCQPANA